MAKHKNMVSESDAIIFDGFVAELKAKLNLADWRIERGGKAKDAMASVEFNAPARLVTYRLGDFGSEAITPESLKKTCFHEMLHVLLYDLIQSASSKCTEEELEGAEHRVINVLETLLIEKI